MKKILCKLLGIPTETQVKIIQRDPTTLRLAEWRGDKNLCSSARNVLTNPDLRMMLQVVQNEHPAFIALTHDTPIEARAVWQARAEGYGLALANFMSLAKHEPPPEPLEETFAPTE